VKPLPDYRLELTFANSDVGVYDCRPLLDFGVFRELRDEAYFRQVAAINGTVAWPHEQDICPDTLYLESVKKPACVHRSHRGSARERQSAQVHS
jgi:hypothetical protein